MCVCNLYACMYFVYDSIINISLRERVIAILGGRCILQQPVHAGQFAAVSSSVTISLISPSPGGSWAAAAAAAAVACRLMASVLGHRFAQVAFWRSRLRCSAARVRWTWPDRGQPGRRPPTSPMPASLLQVSSRWMARRGSHWASDRAHDYPCADRTRTDRLNSPG